MCESERGITRTPVKCFPSEVCSSPSTQFPTAAWKWWRGRDVLRRGRALEGAGEAASMAIMAIRRIVGQIKNLKQDEVYGGNDVHGVETCLLIYFDLLARPLSCPLVCLSVCLSVRSFKHTCFSHFFPTFCFIPPCRNSTQRGAYLMSNAYGLALDAARLGLPAAPRSDTAAKYSKKRHSIIPKMTFNRMVCSYSPVDVFPRW